MKAISFFSGVGMFDFGLHAAGIEIVAQVEYEEYPQHVLQKNWEFFATNKPPQIYGDIRTITANDLPAGAELFIGGFPCQPFSTAGKRKGADDSRNMWPEFYRLIADYKPLYVILENVSALLVPTDDNEPYAITVLRDLAQSGYNVSWSTFRASDCGFPHARERVWFFAELGDLHDKRQERSDIHKNRNQAQNRGRIRKASNADALANTDSRRESSVHDRSAGGEHQRSGHKTSSDIGATTPRNIKWLQPIARRVTEPGMGRKSHGLACWMDRPQQIAGRNQAQYAHEPPRLVPGHPENWSKRIKALGNGGIPHIAYAIAKALIEDSKK